jgi:hypothetical protein
MLVDMLFPYIKKQDINMEAAFLLIKQLPLYWIDLVMVNTTWKICHQFHLNLHIVFVKFL